MGPRELLTCMVGGFALAISAAVPAQSVSAPEITAQGFDMREPQTGRLGKFGRLRVRFQAAERIAELVIKERSYEVDLARTLESDNFHLFGAQARVLNRRDITLDFENYINRKLESEGRYYFSLTLKDKEGRVASASLSVIVEGEKSSLMKERLDRIDRGVFSFRRVGPGPVIGVADFGITWKTIEDTNVTIRIVKSGGGATKLLRLVEPAFDSVDSKTQLAGSAAGARLAAAIEIATARNGAAGETFAVVIRERPYLLKINESRTLLSEVGTTVILNGEFKH